MVMCVQPLYRQKQHENEGVNKQNLLVVEWFFGIHPILRRARKEMADVVLGQTRAGRRGPWSRLSDPSLGRT